jgi:hypothetical protein
MQQADSILAKHRSKMTRVEGFCHCSQRVHSRLLQLLVLGLKNILDISLRCYVWFGFDSETWP